VVRGTPWEGFRTSLLGQGRPDDLGDLRQRLGDLRRIAASARLTTGDFAVLDRQALLLVGFGALTLATSAAAPAYMRWYVHMRRPDADERRLCLPEEREGAQDAE
jgi:hypothetical protein